ncbi:MAG TPA: LytR C-terminal domain-containing protein [Solirubrobacterales bacterium]|nr:LytR C-terminal domain-containing protein [Solirubrobacterales bacterium]
MAEDLLPFSEVTAAIAAVSVIGIFLLLPLYLSQRRDVLRLREWMHGNPDFAEEDLALSDQRLDKAERDLERAYQDRGEPVPGTVEFEAIKAATLVEDPKKGQTVGIPAISQEATSERPALAQVTMERAALQPHPRWKMFVARVTQPRWLAVIAVGALVLGTAGILIVDRVLREDEPGTPAASQASGIEVAVLNTTTASGIAGRVAAQIEESGFIRGEVGNIERETSQTLVMYAPDQERAAKRVARELGDVAVQRIDREVQAAAGGADVVVILGQDRVG